MASARGLLLAASAVALAAATSAERTSDQASDQPYISNVTAWCYKTGQANSALFGATIDRHAEESISNVVHLREDAMTWCYSSHYYYNSPPQQCEIAEPKYDSNATSYDNVAMRGYDLIQTPPNADCDTPRVMYIHGGSWFYYSPFGSGHYYVHTSKIAHETGSVVMSIDYPLIGGWRCKKGGKHCKTDGTYVGQFKDVMDFLENAWRWLAEHGPNGQKCRGKTPPMFLAGDSSGGGSAFSFMLKLNQLWQDGDCKGLQRPSGAFLESPWLNLRSDTPTYYSNNFAAFPNIRKASNNPAEGALTGDLLYHNLEASKNVGDPWPVTQAYYLNGLQYCGLRAGKIPDSFPGSCGSNQSSEAQARYWLASPYHAELKHLGGLPPLYFATSATELLTGETSFIAERAASVGVHVTSQLFYGMWHTFPQWSEGCQGPYGKLWQGVMALSHYGDFVREVTQALRRCPRKVYGPRRAGGANGPTKTYRLAVNALNDLDMEPDPDAIPKLEMDICGNGSFLQGRGRLRGRDAAAADGGEEDAAMLQTFVSAEVARDAAVEL